MTAVPKIKVAIERPVTTVPKTNYELDCVICYNTEDENYVTTLSCTHSFHTECLRDWFKKTIACPCCRKPADMKELEKKTEIKAQK